jgi:hypothetical protein
LRDVCEYDPREDEKSDLMIGKESECGYDSNSFCTYEISTVARAAYSLLSGVMF